MTLDQICSDLISPVYPYRPSALLLCPRVAPQHVSAALVLQYVSNSHPPIYQYGDLDFIAGLFWYSLTLLNDPRQPVHEFGQRPGNRERGDAALSGPRSCYPSQHHGTAAAQVRVTDYRDTAAHSNIFSPDSQCLQLHPPYLRPFPYHTTPLFHRQQSTGKHRMSRIPLHARLFLFAVTEE